MALISNENLLEEFEIVEEKAEKALKKIHLLYKDILGSCDADTEGASLSASDFSEHNVNVRKSSTVKQDVPLVKPKVKRSAGEKSELSVKCQRIPKPSVVRGKPSYECPRENYWSHFQNDFVIPESGYQNPIEHRLSVIKTTGTKAQTSDRNAKHCCPLKVTIPEPFQMTVRELQQKEMKELAKQKLKEKWSKSVENELRKKIYARQVPGHVHLPLYQKIVEAYEQKKVLRKQQTLQRLKELIRPFNLTENNNWKYQKSKSMPDLTLLDTKFKAKPVPDNLLSSYISKSLKEREERRKIRIAERSRALLKSSVLPFSRKKPITRSASMVKLNQENANTTVLISCNNKSKLCKGLSRLEQKKIFEQWNNSVASVTQKYSSDKDAIIESTVAKTKEFFTSQALPFYELPVKMTTSAMLRERQNRIVLNERKTNEQQKFVEETQRIENEKQLKKIFGPKLRQAIPTLDMKKQIEDQLKCYRESRLVRQEEYQKELEEMKLRVQKQPLLVERQSKIGTKCTKSQFDGNAEISDNDDDAASKTSEAQSDSTDRNSSSLLQT